MSHEFIIELKNAPTKKKKIALGVGCNPKQLDEMKTNDGYLIKGFPTILIPFENVISIRQAEENSKYTEIEYYYDEILDDYSAYFCGYCNGIIYQAFCHPLDDMGCSGSGRTYEISFYEAMEGLKKAIELFDNSIYPDPSRADELKIFYDKFKYSTDSVFKITFF